MRPIDKELVKLVDSIIELKADLLKARTDQAKTALSRQVEYVEGAIDTRVYDIYKLSPQDIEVIESEQ